MTVKNIAVGVGLFVLLVSGIWWLSAPHNYDDCAIKAMREAKTERAAIIASGACREKFRSYGSSSYFKNQAPQVNIFAGRTEPKRPNPFQKYLDAPDPVD